MDWMRVTKLKLNPDKTEVLLVSQKADQGTGMCPLKTEMYSLGVFLDLSPSVDAQGFTCTDKASALAVPVPGEI